MTDSPSESSLLLWLLAAAVAMLAAHVSLGWIRLAQRETLARMRWRSVLVAAAVLGSGVSGAMLLALTARALPFPLGYSWLTAPSVWLCAVVGAVPVSALLAYRQRWWALLSTTVALSVMIGLVHWSWLEAVGFRPGLQWRVEWVVAAAVVVVSACGAAVWVGFSGVMHDSQRLTVRRVGCMFLLGLALVAGEEMLMHASDMGAQEGSVYADELPGLVPALVCGVLLPLVLAVLALDLSMRRSRYGSHHYSEGRKRSNGIAPQRRRRRRHRVPTL